MRKTARSSLLLAALVAAPLLLPGPADAQRRIIGADPAREAPAEEEKKDEKAVSPEEAAKREEEKKRAAEEARKKAEEAEQKAAEAEAKREAEEEAKREAARKAAEEKKRLAEEAKQRAEEEVRKKEEARLQALRDGRLKTAKARRRLNREDGKLRGAISFTPGGPESSKVVEVRVDVAEHLKVADPRFGERKPLTGLRLIATIKEPSTGANAEERRYVVHPLQTPGAYGFHHTPRMDGEHTVLISGKDKKGESFTFEFPVHVGTWPPPDFDAEEKNNARFEVSAGGRRPIVGR